MFGPMTDAEAKALEEAQVIAAKNGNLHGVARPAEHLRPAMRFLNGKGASIPLERALTQAEALEKLAGVIKPALEQCKREDGTIDPYLLAAMILKETAT